MTTKEVVLRLIQQYSDKIIVLKLQERYLQRKAIVITDRTWQLSLGKVQAELHADEDYLKFLNEVCEESLESESVAMAKPADTLKKH